MIRKQTKLWTCKDGSKIRICDMTDQHLTNAIKMVERFAEHATFQAMYDGWKVLCSLQGEMAIDQVESDLEHIESYGIAPEEVCSLYSELCIDENRRKAEMWTI